MRTLRDLWDNIKHTNICNIGVPEGEEQEKGPEKIFEEIIAKNTHSSPGSTENPLQDEAKEECGKTHINQTNKN